MHAQKALGACPVPYITRVMIWLPPTPQSLSPSLMVASGIALTSPVNPQCSAQCWDTFKLSILSVLPSVPVTCLPSTYSQVWDVPLHAFAGFLEQPAPKASLGCLGLEQPWAKDKTPVQTQCQV